MAKHHKYDNNKQTKRKHVYRKFFGEEFPKRLSNSRYCIVIFGNRETNYCECTCCLYGKKHTVKSWKKYRKHQWKEVPHV